MTNPRHNIRDVRAARGTKLTAKSWMTEAPLRMLMNNLDPEVAENPHELVVYGGIGRAARTWADFVKIVETLRDLNEDETLMVQSGKPVGVICHGPWTLIEAGVLDGRNITSWPSLKTDLINAGANWLDKEVIVDHGLVSSRKPADLPAFTRKLVETFAEGRQKQPAPIH